MLIIVTIIGALLVNNLAVAYLESSTINIRSYSPRDPDNIISYEGLQVDRYDTLRNPSYWTAGCHQNWRFQDDILFKIDLPGVSRGFASHKIEYEWAEPVALGQVFILLTDESADGLILRIEFDDSGGVCELDK